MKSRIALITLLILTGLSIQSCGGSKKLKNMTVRERLEHAKKLYNDGKYFEAKNQFQILILNNPGSRIIDEAQFYYAETFYATKEYITAAAEYERLINRYPNSEYLDDSSYKIGCSYFKLSPKAQLDQKYTYQAIDFFQQFLDEFPNSEHVKDVTDKLRQCRDKLAEKEFSTGVLYKKGQHYTAAIISFDEVLKKFYDTKYAEDSLYWKAYCHYQINEPAKARDAINILLKKYSSSKLKERAKDLASKIATELDNK